MGPVSRVLSCQICVRFYRWLTGFTAYLLRLWRGMRSWYSLLILVGGAKRFATGSKFVVGVKGQSFFSWRASASVLMAFSNWKVFTSCQFSLVNYGGGELVVQSSSGRVGHGGLHSVLCERRVASTGRIGTRAVSRGFVFPGTKDFGRSSGSIDVAG